MTDKISNPPVAGLNGLQKVILRTPSGYTAEVYTHGAHITKWTTPSGEDILFCSKQAIFSPPTAIRGGVPVCFPQFGDMGPCKAQHGFARNSTFEVTASTPFSVRMVLRSPTGDGSMLSPEFPAPFELTINVTVTDDAKLHQEMVVKNTAAEGDASAAPFSFTAALHTYFRLHNGIASASIEGLQGVKYLDSLQARKECIEENKTITFPGEVDRIYCGAPDELQIVDGGQDGKEEEERRVAVDKNGFNDVVVWNPAAEKAKKMKDFGDEEWKDMVCLEVAQAGSGAVELAPGKQWVGTQTLEISW